MKHVNINTLCPMCNDGVEITMHVLVKCSFAQACWDKVDGSDMIDTLVTFLSRMLNVFDRWSITRR